MDIMQKQYPLTHIDFLQNDACMEFCLYKNGRPYYAFLIKKNDNFYAYANTCPHQNRMLQWGQNQFLTKDKAKVMCAAHGATFEIETGLCDAGPCTGDRLTQLPIIIDNNVVLVTHVEQ